MDRIAEEVLDDSFTTSLAGVSKEFAESGSSIWFALGLARGSIKERWFSSVIPAMNGKLAPADEGLSYVQSGAAQGGKFLLRDAVQELGAELIGADLLTRYGTWPLYSKFFDYKLPLFHHLHLTDEAAARVGRIGKPEAYYFPPQLNNHLGEFPVTYFGFDPDVSREQVRQAITSAWASYAAAKEGVIANRALVDAAQLALAGVIEERNVGQRTTLDVLNAQADVTNARIDIVGAERDLQVPFDGVPERPTHVLGSSERFLSGERRQRPALRARLDGVAGEQRRDESDRDLRGAIGGDRGEQVADVGVAVALQQGRAVAGDLLGVQRQVFFVPLGGFDTHDSQVANQGRLLATVAQAIERPSNVAVPRPTSSRMTSERSVA